MEVWTFYHIYKGLLPWALLKDVNITAAKICYHNNYKYLLPCHDNYEDPLPSQLQRSLNHMIREMSRFTLTIVQTYSDLCPDLLWLLSRITLTFVQTYPDICPDVLWRLSRRTLTFVQTYSDFCPDLLWLLSRLTLTFVQTYSDHC